MKIVFITYFLQMVIYILQFSIGNIEIEVTIQAKCPDKYIIDSKGLLSRGRIIIPTIPSTILKASI